MDAGERADELRLVRGIQVDQQKRIARMSDVDLGSTREEAEATRRSYKKRTKSGVRVTKGKLGRR